MPAGWAVKDADVFEFLQNDRRCWYVAASVVIDKLLMLTRMIRELGLPPGPLGAKGTRLITNGQAQVAEDELRTIVIRRMVSRCVPWHN